jgi:hypothetical protein
LKLVAKADENNRFRDPGVVPEPLWQNSSAVRVNFEFFALAEIDHFEGLAQGRVGGKLAQNALNLFDQTETPSLDGCVIEMGVTVDFIRALFREHGAKWRRDGNAPLGINLVVKARGKFVHLPVSATP